MGCELFVKHVWLDRVLLRVMQFGLFSSQCEDAVFRLLKLMQRDMERYRFSEYAFHWLNLEIQEKVGTTNIVVMVGAITLLLHVQTGINALQFASYNIASSKCYEQLLSQLSLGSLTTNFRYLK